MSELTPFPSCARCGKPFLVEDKFIRGTNLIEDFLVCNECIDRVRIELGFNHDIGS
jgi:hypothetical protein